MAALFGALAGVLGSVLSSETERLPTGPTIVLCATAIVLVSLAAAPRRGLLWRELRVRRDRRRLRLAAVLADLHELELQHPGVEHGHSAAVLSVMSGGTLPSLLELERRGQVRGLGVDEWRSRTRAGRRPRRDLRTDRDPADRDRRRRGRALPGTFLVLRRLSLVSDAISHSILLGIVLGFFVVGSVNSPLLLKQRPSA